MDTGIIASRYAAALFRYAAEQGATDTVFGEADRLLTAFSAVPGLRDVMDDGVMVGAEAKTALVRTALGGKISPTMERFLRLLDQQGRMDCIRLIFRDYAQLYYREKGIVPARLVTAREASPALLASLKALVKSRTGREAEIHAEVDPSLIGGFLFDLGDEMLDASVASQLEKIRRSLIEKNKRIV